MAKRTLEEVVESIDSRLARVEQILPTLATKDELHALSTKDDLRATENRLRSDFATKDDLRAVGAETRRHFDVVAERLEGHIQLLADGQLALHEQMNRGFADVASQIQNLDRRVMRLEATPRR